MGIDSDNCDTIGIILQKYWWPFV